MCTCCHYPHFSDKEAEVQGGARSSEVTPLGGGRAGIWQNLLLFLEETRKGNQKRETTLERKASTQGLLKVSGLKIIFLLWTRPFYTHVTLLPTLPALETHRPLIRFPDPREPVPG